MFFCYFNKIFFKFQTTFHKIFASIYQQNPVTVKVEKSEKIEPDTENFQ